MSAFLDKIKESCMSVLPVSIIVFVLSMTLGGANAATLTNFAICVVLLIVGISLFSMGVDMSMMKIGNCLGSATSKSKDVVLMAIIATILGFVITVAEPDLMVLASQVPGLGGKWAIVLTVGLGTGIFLAIAVMRIMFRIDLRIIFGIFYGIIIVLSFFVPAEFIPLSFDTSGATTGPISVPFIISFGAGISAIRAGKESENDSFGLIGMLSIGPILAVMIMGLFVTPSSNIVMESVESITSFSQIFAAIGGGILQQLLDVLIIIAPIAAIFLVINFTMIKVSKVELARIMIGLAYNYFGIVLFLAGANVGFLPIGTSLSVAIAGQAYSWVLIPIVMVIGACMVFAEPAVHILTKQIKEVTGGTISKKVICITISIGVSIALGLVVIRNFLEIPITYLLVPLLIILITLLFFCPKLFVAIAFDSGGVATGAVAATFIVPFIKGVCSVLGNSQLLFGFGTIAFIALTPVLCIEVLGVIFNILSNKNKTKTKERKKTKIQIIDFDYGE